MKAPEENGNPVIEEQQGKALDLLQKLEDLDDVQSVYMNINISPS